MVGLWYWSRHSPCLPVSRTAIWLCHFSYWKGRGCFPVPCMWAALETCFGKWDVCYHTGHKQSWKKNKTQQKIPCVFPVVSCSSEIAKRTSSGWPAGKKVEWRKAKCSQLSRLMPSSSATAGWVPEQHEPTEEQVSLAKCPSPPKSPAGDLVAKLMLVL